MEFTAFCKTENSDITRHAANKRRQDVEVERKKDDEYWWMKANQVISVNLNESKSAHQNTALTMEVHAKIKVKRNTNTE